MTGIIALSNQGIEMASKLSGFLGDSTCYALPKWEWQGFVPIEGGLTDFCGQIFYKHQALVFIMASGIAVRSIAPWIRDKTTDPAILVMDEKGKNVISLLSGHLGGGNALTLKIAGYLSANPVITTASDINGLPSVDTLAQSKGLLIDSMEDAKRITAMIINRENVRVVDEYGILDDMVKLESGDDAAGKIIVTNQASVREKKPFVRLIPQNIILGIGCQKGVAPEKMMDFINHLCSHHNIDMNSIYTIASIDLKTNEPALQESAKKFECSLEFYSCQALQRVDHLFEGSDFVKSNTGVASVSATSAYLAGGESGRFIVEKEIYDGMTISIFEQHNRIK
jgi:cobalt-precorrin 5A hydrolase